MATMQDLPYASRLTRLLGPLDWIFIFGSRHQRLGDMAAGTVVITETP